MPTVGGHYGQYAFGCFRMMANVITFVTRLIHSINHTFVGSWKLVDFVTPQNVNY